MARSLAIIALSILSAAGLSQAGDTAYVIVQPGYPGSTSLAEGFVEDLSTALTKSGGPADLKGAYHNDAKSALKAIAENKPAFGIVSLGFYLLHRDDLRLKPVLESRPVKGFYLAAKKGKPVTLDELAGQVVSGTPFQEKEFVERILFGAGAGGGPVKPGASSDPAAKTPAGDPARPAVEVSKWKVEATEGFSKGLRDVDRGKARAAFLTELERMDMPNTAAGMNLEVFYQTEKFPIALMVSIGGENEAAKKSAAALESLGKAAEGKELHKVMGIEGFAAVDGKRLKEIEERYAKASGAPAPAGGGEKTAVR